GDLSVNDLSLSDSSTNESNINNFTSTGTVMLNWTPPTEYTDNSVMNDLAGYKIYYGTEPDQLNFFIDIGANLSSYLIENDQRLQTGKVYYFGMTAYNNARIESAMSNIVNKEL
ncbi:MAG: fibronectin type III domain-containing protein, partial [Gammaproteobacteria bacterium]|nr:fibronectin type III domain-containing protein [Gammaproteobacteria bacterium]